MGPITCETCPRYSPSIEADQFGYCAKLGGYYGRNFGCIHHPNFAKLVEENARLRQVIVDLERRIDRRGVKLQKAFAEARNLGIESIQDILAESEPSNAH